jgi:hypothetical protein
MVGMRPAMPHYMRARCASVLVDISGGESGLDSARRLVENDPDDGSSVILISTRREEEMITSVSDVAART